jgi:hypothetical protein
MKRYQVWVNNNFILETSTADEAKTIQKRLFLAKAGKVAIKSVKVDEIKIPNRDTWEYPQGIKSE